MESGKYDKCYSSNLEDYYANSIDEVIGDIANDTEEFPATVTIGEADSVTKSIGDFLKLDVLFEDCQERACDECGEWVDGWLEQVTPEDEIALKTLIEAWATGTENQPRFFGVENVKEITVEILNEDGDYKIKTNENETSQ